MREDLPGLPRAALARGAGGRGEQSASHGSGGRGVRVRGAGRRVLGARTLFSDGHVSHVPSYEDANATVGGPALRPRRLRKAAAPHSRLGVRLQRVNLGAGHQRWAHSGGRDRGLGTLSQSPVPRSRQGRGQSPPRADRGHLAFKTRGRRVLPVASGLLGVLALSSPLPARASGRVAAPSGGGPAPSPGSPFTPPPVTRAAPELPRVQALGAWGGLVTSGASDCSRRSLTLT